MTKRLTRRTDSAMIGGVCAGVADYFNLDPTLVRVLTVLAAVLGLGSIVVVYIIAWVLMPQL